jgi:hypothetical protein
VSDVLEFNTLTNFHCFTIVYDWRYVCVAHSSCYVYMCAGRVSYAYVTVMHVFVR